jgi:periplasmic divalent cation tolerance protein
MISTTVYISFLFFFISLLTYYLSPQILIKRSMTSISSSEYSACITTVSNDEVARKLARSIVEARLAACVNIIPGITSIYEWQSTIHEDNEIILMIKTRREYVPQLIEFVKKTHPYEVPELIELPINSGNPDYLKWIDGIVNQQPSS